MDTTNNILNSTDSHGEEASISSKPWADIVLACFAINVITLSGIVLTAVTRFCVVKKHKTIIETLMVPSFAAGTKDSREGIGIVTGSLSLTHTCISFCDFHLLL